MRTTKRNKPTQAKLAKTNRTPKQRAPLYEHLQELKRRLLYVVVSIAIGSAIAYGFERKLIDILLVPSHGQEFVYTSPMGGVNFLFSVCLFIGVALSVPIIVYHLLQFLFPLMQRTTMRFVYMCSIASGLIAICGILFGYYAGLPAALHFLLKQQFHNGQVEALISIQSYFSFVTAYMVGAAIMFQLPLILIIINRIKPLKPSQMFKAERAVIAFAFIAAFIMNPTPNVIDQLLVVVPILIMYQLGIGLVWMINKYTQTPDYVLALREQDAQRQAERASRELVPYSVFEPVEPLPEPVTPEIVEATEPTPQPKPVRVTQYTDGAPTPRRNYMPLRGQLVQ